MADFRSLILLLLAAMLLLMSIAAGIGKSPLDFPAWADTSINQVRLCDEFGSMVTVLGEHIPWQRGQLSEDFPFHVSYLNKDKTEVWMLVGHPGDRDENFEMLVRKASLQDVADPVLPARSFETGKGIHLGMTIGQIVEILGAGKRSKKGRQEHLEYQISFNDSNGVYDGLIEMCNQPEYFQKYIFIDGRLAEVHIGFTEP